jgi:hypothetical protein
MKIVTFPQLQQHHPLQSPAWRWRRAQWLAQRGRRCSCRRDDVETRSADGYLRALARSRPGTPFAAILRRYPAVHGAHQLHEQGGALRVEVQARLLARQSTEEIARRTSVAVEVVQRFEALFFNVIGHLHARDWIVTHAIGWWRFDPSRGRDPATLLRAFGYHGGPLLLDAALSYLLGERMRVPPALDPLTPEGRLDRAMRMAILIETLPWGASTDEKLFKLHAELLETARQASFRRPPRAVVPPCVPEVLEKLAAEASQRSTGQGQTTRHEGDGLPLQGTG